MFFKKILVLTCIVFFVAANFTLLALTSQGLVPRNSIERLTISLLSPFQRIVSRTASWSENIWLSYFSTVSAVEENQELKKLALAVEYQNRCRELELENQRLRRFVNFNGPGREVLVAARVVARDPSPWYKTIMIDRGEEHGVTRDCLLLSPKALSGRLLRFRSSTQGFFLSRIGTVLLMLWYKNPGHGVWLKVTIRNNVCLNML